MAKRAAIRPRRQPTQARSQETVRALLDATARVLQREGYDRASTNRVAQTAGVNIGSLYQYFPSKDALVAAVIDRHLVQVSAVLGAALQSTAELPLAEAARAIVRAHIQIHATSSKLHRVLLEQVPRVERINPIMAFRTSLVDVVRSWLESRRAEIRVRDLGFAAFALVHTVDALTQAAITERPEYLTDGTFVDRLTEATLAFLGVEA